jgi:EAL domain-containing protein (putative c-di-GMP-specific phosphodiesterase class I)
MYAAKSAGGSRVVRADAHSEDAPIDLVGALSRRELRLHYQPVVSLLSGAVLGVTTVIKWRHPERGMLPGTEVRAAIGAGASSLPVVHWAIDRAISDVRTVAPGRVDHVSVWIPIPGRAALAASTRTAVATSFAGPDGTLTPDSAPSIVLDVHEQDVAQLTRRRAMHHHLDALLHEGPLALGVERFTADAVPVGTLQLLGAASVSIDPELLVEAAQNETTEELVRSLVTGAAALGVIAVAMDVESQEQLDHARALGIHAVYGDLIGPPAPLDTYSDLLHGGRMSLPETSVEAGTVEAETVEADQPGRPVADLLTDPGADGADSLDAPEAAPRVALPPSGAAPVQPRRPPTPARPERAAGRAAERVVERPAPGPVIDAPPPTTPRVVLGEDIGTSLAAELGIELPPLPDPEPAPAPAPPTLQERLRAARRSRPADGRQ